TAFAENTFDLITVGQALHWFDRDKFYQETTRVGKPGSLLAVWGYALLYIETGIDEIITDFYSHTVGPYWDEARRLVEQQYKTISFPFEEIPTPGFSIDVEWSFTQLTGYLESWSATQKFIQAKHFNPVPELMEKLKPYWQINEIKPVRFPVFLRLGTIKK
ncbi:MAG TPA: methyltransferase domain-containing protein, partial [Ohtaekwangia sp.]